MMWKVALFIHNEIINVAHSGVFTRFTNSFNTKNFDASHLVLYCVLKHVPQIKPLMPILSYTDPVQLQFFKKQYKATNVQRLCTSGLY